MTPGEQLLQTAVAKQLLSADEAAAVLRRAQEGERDVSALLVDEGILTQRTVTALLRESSAIAPTVAHPPPAADETLPTDPTIAAPTAEADLPERLGEFELDALLGMGGMGAVYRARQVSLDRHVALKVIAPRVAGDPETRQRFIREAKVAAAINHPHVITIHQVGEEQGQVFMAMELVTGGDAEDLAATAGGTLDERRALQLVRDACKGLVAIEQQGLIHRDIKPANLFLTADGSAKLADLGMARSQAGDDKVTQSGVIVGTPAYMAPEQAEGHPCDIRADVYALGATLYRLCVGHPPYQGSSALRVMTKVLNDPVPDPRKANPRLSVETGRLIARCLAKSPDGRFPSAQALLSALEQALARLDAPRAGWGAAPCVLLTLFLLSSCFSCGGLAVLSSAGKANEDIQRFVDAAIVTPAGLDAAQGEVVLEGVVLEARGETPTLDGRAMLFVQERTVSANDRRDNKTVARRAKELYLGEHAVRLSPATRMYGLQSLGVVVEENEDGDAVMAEGIPLDLPVTVLGVAHDGTLSAEAVAAGLTRADALAALHARVKDPGRWGLVLLLFGGGGLVLCVLLARRR